MSRTLPLNTDDLPDGFEVRDHQLIRRIGQGAYGGVWLATNALGTLRAVKIVFRDRFEDERPYLREFEGVRQYEPLSRSHEGLIDILQVGMDAAHGCFYYVMELADSAAVEPSEAYRPLSLKALVERSGGRIDALETARIGERLAAALAHLHEAGLVHRDVKPSNILIAESQAKLADVGLVAGRGGEMTFVGTEGYVPREGPGEAPADIFALGMALYEAASGRHHRDFPSYPQAFANPQEREAYAELNQILLKACARDVAERYASAKELRSELLLMQAGQSIRRLRLNERRVTLLRKLAVGLAAVGLIVSGGYFWQLRETGRNRALAESESRLASVERANAQRLRENLYAADLSSAQALVDKGNRGGAIRLLDAYLPTADGDPDLRGFDWFWLRSQLEGDAHRALPDLGAIVRYGRYESDGTLFLGTVDGKVWRWETAKQSYEPVAELPEGESIFYATQSRDGLWLLGGNAGLKRSDGKTLVARDSRFWEVSPDGRWAVGTERPEYSAAANRIVVNDLRGEEPPRLLADTAHWAAFSRDGRWLLTAGAAGRFQLWDVAEGFVAARAFDSAPTDATCLGIAFSPDGRRVAAGLNGGMALIWEVDSGRLLHVVRGEETDGVWQPRFSPDGSLIAAACGQKIWLIDAERGTLEHRLEGHTDDTICVSFHPDGRTLASGGKDGIVRLWSLENWRARDRELEPLRMRNLPVISADGSCVAGVTRRGPVTVLEASSGEMLASFGGESDWPLGFSRDGSEMITTTRFADIRRWDVARGAQRSYTPLEDAGEPGSGVVAASPDGRWLVGGLDSGVMVVWDTRTGRIDRRLEGHTQTLGRLAFSADGVWMASCGYDRRVFLWETAAWRGRQLADHSHNAMGLAFSPDGRWLATASWDGMARIFDLPSGALVKIVRGETSSLDGICFTPDSATLAFARADHCVALVDTRTWRETVVLPGADLLAEVHHLLALPDGSAILGCSDDGRDGRIWRLPKNGL